MFVSVPLATAQHCGRKVYGYENLYKCHNKATFTAIMKSFSLTCMRSGYDKYTAETMTHALRIPFEVLCNLQLELAIVF
jgi:hypothetical protein